MEDAVSIVEDELRIHAPKGGEPLQEDERRLRDAIMHVINIDPDFTVVAVTIGFGKEGRKALWMEYGHRMVSHRPGLKPLGFIAARPFIRASFEATKDRVIARFYERLQAELRVLNG